MKAAERIATFLEAQAAELDAAENTRLAYARDLKDFTHWLERKSTDFLSVSQDQIESYLIDLDAAGMARSTRARRLSAIRQFSTGTTRSPNVDFRTHGNARPMCGRALPWVIRP